MIERLRKAEQLIIDIQQELKEKHNEAMKPVIEWIESQGFTFNTTEKMYEKRDKLTAFIMHPELDYNYISDDTYVVIIHDEDGRDLWVDDEIRTFDYFKSVIKEQFLSKLDKMSTFTFTYTASAPHIDIFITKMRNDLNSLSCRNIETMIVES